MERDLVDPLSLFVVPLGQTEKSPAEKTGESLEKTVLKKVLTDIREEGFGGGDIHTIRDEFVVIGNGDQLFQCRARSWTLYDDSHYSCKISDYFSQEDEGKRTVFFHFDRTKAIQTIEYYNEFEVGHNQFEKRSFHGNQEAFLKELLNASVNNAHTEEFMRVIAARGTVRENSPQWNQPNR